MTNSQTLSCPFYTVDVFISTAFTGNPLAIVMQADGLSDDQMQLIAREFNLSETVFTQQPDDASNTASVRIFTPASELPFAGHPTIGCAIHLAQQQHASESFNTEIKLEELAGLVSVQVNSVNGQIKAELSAPVIPTLAEAQSVTQKATSHIDGAMGEN